MTVYLDLAFALNSAINYLLLLSAAYLAGAPLCRVRLLLAAALGGLYAVLCFLPSAAFLRGIWCQLLLLALMSILSFGLRRQTLRLAALTAAVGAILAGAAVALAQFFHVTLYLPQHGRIFYPLQARALLLLAALCCFLCRIAFRCAAAATSRIIPLAIRLNNRTVPLSALIDTGNSLRDPLTNEPLIIVDTKIAAHLLPEAGLTAQALANPSALFSTLATSYPNLRFRLIPYRAVGTASGLLLAVRCDVVEKPPKAVSRLVAFSPTPLSSDEKFHALTGGCL